MRPKIKERIDENPAENECRHFWIIEVANGPTSIGECKHCGQQKEFLNAFPDFNPLKKNRNPLELPVMKGVKVDKDSNS